MNRDRDGIRVSLLRPNSHNYREDVMVVLPGKNGSNAFQMLKVMSLVGYFRTTLELGVENGNILLEVRCEGDSIWEFNRRIPIDVAEQWCEKNCEEAVIE